MERNDRAFLDRIWKHVSASIPRVPPNPQLRRRLYGAFFFITAVTLGFSSSQAIQHQAVEDWLVKNPPKDPIWRATAESRGLHQVRDVFLEKWNRFMPRDLTANAAWWDAERQALWIISAPGNTPEIYLYAAQTTPARSASPTPALTPLGRGWSALEAFQQLKVSASKLGSPPKRFALKSDPRRWDF